jgi:hypothetical protein
MKNFTIKIVLMLCMVTQLSIEVKSENKIFSDVSSARIQLIHNAADLAADTVDVFVNGELFLPDFAFRTATPFVDVPADVELTIDIAPAGAGIENSVFDITVEFDVDETYVIVANGIVSETGYDPVEPFTIYPFAPAREEGENENETDLLVFHGSTDAPEVSVWAMGGESALFTFDYGQFAGYLGLPTDDYVLEIRTADGETTVVSYSAPLATLEQEGAALTVVASGFLNPANNSDGPAFGLYVATAAGGELIPLPVYEEDEEEITCAFSQGYWFANPHTVWPYDVEVGGLTFTQEDGQAFWPPNTPTRRAFTQYSAIYLSGVTVSLFPELEDAMETIDNYFADVYPGPAGMNVNQAAGFIGDWIDQNHCEEQEPEPEFARAQIIHNAADLAAETVDVFVNGEIFVPDFAFRTATPFVDVPAGVELTIDIAPAGAGIENSVFDITVEFETDETYIIVANGIVSETGYDPVEPFTVYPFAPAREVGENADETDLLVFHGSTDAPEVSVWLMGGESALFTFGYGDFAGYLGLPTDDYVLEIRTADGETTVVTYEAPLQTLGLEGAAITVVASGFLNPASNSDGPAFGLYVATAAGGDLIPLPVYEEEPGPELARLQIIHNAADLAAESVDVFVNGEILLEDFLFRTATPFVDVPAGVELTIDIAPAGAGIENSVFDITVEFETDETYIIVANGIVSETGYDPVEPFTVYPFAPAREMGENTDETDLLVFHGSTDAPEVSVWPMGGESALFTFGYGDFAGYLGLPTDDYVLEIRTADGETTVVAYEAPLQTFGLEGAAITVVASGFLNPANNSDGPAFGLYVATAAGGDLIPLPVYEEDDDSYVVTCAYSQGYWFANRNTVWPYDVEVGGMSFTQEEGKAFWPPNTPTRRAFTQYSAIFLSGVTVSEFPELEQAMETIDDYFANNYPAAAGHEVNRAAGKIGNWIDSNHCENNESVLTIKEKTNPVNVFPNPFRDQFSVEFSLEESAYVTLEVYNLSGEKIAVLFNGYVKANEVQSISMNTINLPDGIYFYRMTSDGNIYMDKLIRVR